MNIFQKLSLSRAKAYKRCFLDENGELTPDAEIVLADLKVFCRADRSSFMKGDPNGTALLEGRREVWLRMNSFLRLDLSEIYNLKEKVNE